MERQSILNQEYVQKNIQLKNSFTPYHQFGNQIKNVVTDVDHFPYTRFYRGVYNMNTPVIWEREAGYKRLNNNGYDFTPIYSIQKPTYSFQVPCSTILPSDFTEPNNVSMKNRNINISP